MQVGLVRTRSITVTGGWELHVHQSWSPVNASGVTSVEHQKSIRETIVILSGKSLLVLILGIELTHFRSKLLGIGVRATNVTTEEISTLGSGSLLSDPSGHVVRTSTRITVHLRHYLHLVGIHKLATVGSSVNSSDRVRPIRATSHIRVRGEALDFALRGSSRNLVVILL